MNRNASGDRRVHISDGCIHPIRFQWFLYKHILITPIWLYLENCWIKMELHSSWLPGDDLHHSILPSYRYSRPWSNWTDWLTKHGIKEGVFRRIHSENTSYFMIGLFCSHDLTAILSYNKVFPWYWISVISHEILSE